MKKTFTLFSLIAVLAVLAGRAAADCGNCDKGHEKKAAAGHSCEMGCPTHMAGAEVSVANIADGVTVTIITKDAAKVKELQEKAAKHFAKKDKAAAGAWICPMGCATSDKAGKCPKCKMELKKK
jgi:hypothetical protein